MLIRQELPSNIGRSDKNYRAARGGDLQKSFYLMSALATVPARLTNSPFGETRF
jgi:hypothetical protein